jgi:segregation and condensation protein A
MEFSASTLEIQMACYEGPLAVLITLIKKNRVSIWDIPVALITEKFLQYVEVVRELQLKVAEDFIEMASLLIFIKSRMLLPTQGAGGDDADPREELVERIIEYERLKAMSNNLQTLPLLEEDTFVRRTGNTDGEEEYHLLSLCGIFFELIKSRQETYLEVLEFRPTLEEKLALLAGVLQEQGVYVWNLAEPQETADKVATILAMLELTKLRKATVTQRRPFGAITLRRRDGVPLDHPPSRQEI